MNTSLPFGYTKGEMTSLIVSGLIFIISIINSLFNLTLFDIPTHTFAILAIFVASLVLWLFVSIDWPSLVTLIALGFLPEVTYAEVFTLSFGNTTFVFLLFTFIVTYALEQTNFLKRLTSQAINSEWAQTEYSLAFYDRVSCCRLIYCLFCSPSHLIYDCLPCLPTDHGTIWLEKRRSQCF